MGRLPFKTDPKSFRCRLRKPAAIYDTPLRVTTQVVKGEYSRDALFPNQFPAKKRPAPSLLPRLEYKIYIRISFFCVKFQSKSAQRRTMTVMPAFVGNAGIPRVIAQSVIFCDRQSIHIRPKRDLLTGFSPLFKRVKPAPVVSKPVPSVNNPEVSVIPQKRLDPLSLHG